MSAACRATAVTLQREWLALLVLTCCTLHVQRVKTLGAAMTCGGGGYGGSSSARDAVCSSSSCSIGWGAVACRYCRHVARGVQNRSRRAHVGSVWSLSAKTGGTLLPCVPPVEWHTAPADCCVSLWRRWHPGQRLAQRWGSRCSGACSGQPVHAAAAKATRPRQRLDGVQEVWRAPGWTNGIFRGSVVVFVCISQP
jgi:hypothetical protein